MGGITRAKADCRDAARAASCSDEDDIMAEEIIIVRGNDTLRGDVRVSGAKNSALKLIAASLLGRGETTLHNVPVISDIEIMSKVLARLGARVERRGHDLVIDTAPVNSFEHALRAGFQNAREHLGSRSAHRPLRGGPCGHAGRMPDRRT